MIGVQLVRDPMVLLLDEPTWDLLHHLHPRQPRQEVQQDRHDHHGEAALRHLPLPRPGDLPLPGGRGNTEL